MDWQDQLISLYLFVCKQYQEKLKFYCERITNYADLCFTDEEVLTIFLFGIFQKQKTLKSIYRYTRNHLSEYYPKLPSYTAFVQRINRISDVFVPLIDGIKDEYDSSMTTRELLLLMDSMPIIIAKQGRRFCAKVANEIATPNGYCASKKMYYYGVKLHVVAKSQNGHLPIPEYIGLTAAGMNDQKAYDAIEPFLPNCSFYADKAYQKESTPVLDRRQLTIYTPVKKQKGQKYLDAADKWLSRAISSVRQPIESLFNWLEEKTSIQIASKVRSYNGLMVHVFGRIAAGLLLLLNPAMSS